MARILIVLWLSPIVLFAGWVFLSALDWHLGLAFMTRDVHDRVFDAYRMVLGYDRAELLILLRNALLLDAAILAAIAVYGRREQLGLSALWASKVRQPVEASL